MRKAMVAWTRPADKWATEKAAEMLAAGYDAGTIIRHLEAYGIGLYAAQALVRPKEETQLPEGP